MFYNQYVCEDNLLVKRVLNDVSKDLIPEKNHTNTIMYNGTQSYYNEDLFKWFNSCLDDLVKKEYVREIQLSITECWATKSQKFEKHHRHVHPNSIVSGIFYLDDSDATTEFYLPNHWAFMNDFIRLAPHSKKQVSIKPEPGKLILFPSNIEHETVTNLSSSTRYTVAFNTFFTGTVGTNTMKLTVNLTSVPRN